MSTPTRKKKSRSPAKGDADFGPAASGDAEFPDQEQIAALFAPLRSFMAAQSQERVRAFLDRLSANPPQVLLLEGGASEERLAAAHYWALRLNCEAAEARPREVALLPGLIADAAPSPALARKAPCLACSACVRLIAHLHRDCFFL
ncbi:MAG: hypothetical protein LBH65_04040, partial [Desulfovibrio sp.]|nr:hypothetical protein [Desulfovibrio sp.]